MEQRAVATSSALEGSRRMQLHILANIPRCSKHIDSEATCNDRNSLYVGMEQVGKQSEPRMQRKNAEQTRPSARNH